jgi:hypothetical protein
MAEHPGVMAGTPGIQVVGVVNANINFQCSAGLFPMQNKEIFANGRRKHIEDRLGLN